MAFWNTSALVKLYVRERDSGYFRELMRTSADTAVISHLVLPKCIALCGPKRSHMQFPNTGPRRRIKDFEVTSKAQTSKLCHSDATFSVNPIALSKFVTERRVLSRFAHWIACSWPRR